MKIKDKDIAEFAGVSAPAISYIKKNNYKKYLIYKAGYYSLKIADLDNPLKVAVDLNEIRKELK